MRASVRLRLTVLVVVLTAATAVLAVGWGTHRMRQSLVDEAVEKAFAELEAIAEGGEGVLAGPFGAPFDAELEEIFGSPVDMEFSEAFGGFIEEDAGAFLGGPFPEDFDSVLNGLFLLGAEVEYTSASLSLELLEDQPEAAGLFDALGVAVGDPVAVLFSDGTVARVAPGFGSAIEVIEPVDEPVIPIWELTGMGFEVFGGDPRLVPTDADRDARLEYVTRPVGGFQVVAPVATGDIVDTVDRIRTVMWFAAAALIVLAGAVTWLLTGRALLPVRRITDQVGDITAGTLHERVPVPDTDDEIAELATTMNGMLDRLEQVDHQRRQFVSDASHELRSPVAVLRSEAEVALRHPADTDVEAFADSVLAESDRMGGVVEDLLTLARYDESAPRGTRRVVDLDDLVLAEAARARRVPIDLRGVSAGRVPGRPDELRRVVAHLLDNAARHADVAVAVALGTDGAEVVLTVDDDGEGVAEADRGRVFERFARLEEARARDTGGAGLGLAVVAATVSELGGTVTVTDSPLGGARFAIRLPTPPSPPGQGST